MSTTVPILPAHPVRGAPAPDYIETADAWMAALPAFGVAVNAVGQESETAAVQAEEFAASAEEFATAAEAAAATAQNSAGAPVWVAGNYTNGQLVYSPNSGFIYRKVGDGASATDPGVVITGWRLAIIAAPLYIPTYDASTQAVVNADYGLKGALAQQLVMPDPLDLYVGDIVWAAVENGRSDNTIDLNGAKVNGVTADGGLLTLSDPFASMCFRWTGIDYGWRI